MGLRDIKGSRSAIFVRAVICLAVSMIFVPGHAGAGSGPVCNWDEEAAHAKATLRLGEETNEDVAEPATTTNFPTTLTSHCGRGTELIDTLGKGIVRVPFQNGATINFYPILMTDKPNGQWKCNKVKVRTACVTDSKVTPEATFLTLKVDMTPNASEEVLKVEPNGKVTPPNDGKYFALLPRLRTNRYFKKVDDGAAALAAAEREKCSWGSCRSKKIVAAEKSILTALRHHRLGSLSLAQRQNDVRKFLKTHTGLTLGRKALHQAIMLNEIGAADGAVPNDKFLYASPLELVDAVLWNSAPSYGAHQIDIGSNGGDDLGPFRSSLGRVLNGWDLQFLKAIRDRKVGRITVRPLENWGRVYSIAVWGDFYRISDQLTADLRGPQGEAEYNALYDRFLTAGTGCMALLREKGGIFSKSTFAQLYVIDVENQKGPGRAVGLAKHAQSLAKTRSTAQIEDEMVRWVLNLKTGSDHLKDVKRRSKNVAEVARAFPDVSGAPASACNSKRYQKEVPKV